MILIGFLVIISINFIISLTSYFIHNNKLRMYIIYFFFSLSLIINTILIIFSLGLSLKESFFFIDIDSGGLFVIEGILIVSLVIFRISRRNLSKIQNLNEFDLWFLLIIFGFLIIIVSDNLLILFTIFILIYYLFKRIFYIDDFKKEREIDNNYFIAWVISTTLLLIGILIISFYTFDFSLDIFIFVEIPDTVKNFLLFIFILAIGLSGGIFPSTLFHLRKYFRDCSYSTLFLYSLFIYISCYLIFKLIAITQLISVISIIVFSIGICSVLLSSIYILIELFTTIDGLNYSIKKLFGYSEMSDFSIFLLLSSIISIIQHSFTNLYLTILIFYFFSIMFIKFSLGYCYLPVITETDEDNINLLGGFGRKYKIYGVAVFLIGIFQIIIIGGIMMNFLLISINGIFNPLLEIIFYTTISVVVIYLLISIIFEASIYVHLYSNEKVDFLKFENIKRLKRYDYIFLLIQLIIIIFITIIFLFERDYFMLFL